MTLTTDDIAQTIRKADGNHDKGAGELAEAIAERIREAGIVVPYERVDPNGLYLREEWATADINGRPLSFSRSGNVFLLTLGSGEEKIVEEISVQDFVGAWVDSILDRE